MLDKIRKFSSGIPAKIMMFIIAIPFVLWGMGSVFNSGNQNTIATINDKKISINEFLSYVRAANPNLDEFRSNPESKIIEKIYFDFISNEIIKLEAEKNNINLPDEALAKIIKNQEMFMKNDKFSRVKYEKFLIERNITATYFEKMYSEQETKRIFFSLISDGFITPSFYVKENYNKRNKIVELSYLDLKNYYNKEITEEEIKIFLEQNKKNFLKKYINIKYIKLLPEVLTGQKDFSKIFFKKLDEIDELIVNESDIEEISKKYNLKIKESNFFNILGEDLNSKNKVKIDKNKIEKIFKNIDKNIFLLDEGNQYTLVEIINKKNVLPSTNDKNTRKIILKFLKVKNIVDKNNILTTKIENNNFKEIGFKNFAQENNLELIKTQILNINDLSIFEKDVLNKIFDLYPKDIKIVSNKALNKNYLIFIDKIKEKDLNKTDQNYILNNLEAELNIKNNIFNIFDNYLKNKYKVETNQKVLEKVKNYFR